MKIKANKFFFFFGVNYSKFTVRMDVGQFESVPFNNKFANSSKICSICKIKFEIGEKISKLKCQHVFHQSCIKSHLRTSKFCPVCQADENKTRVSQRSTERRRDSHRRRRRSRRGISSCRSCSGGSPSERMRYTCVETDLPGRQGAAIEPYAGF